MSIFKQPLIQNPPINQQKKKEKEDSKLNDFDNDNNNCDDFKDNDGGFDDFGDFGGGDGGD